MFSMKSIICIDDSSNQDNVIIYHNITGTVINPMVLSFLIEAFEKMNEKRWILKQF